MSEESVTFASCRSLRRVATPITAPTPALSYPSGTGTYKLIDGGQSPDVVLSGQQGVCGKLVMLFGAAQSETVVHQVYGWKYATTALGTSPLWVPILLYKASVVTSIAPGGSAQTGVIGSGDFVAGAITQNAAVPAGTADVYSAGSDGISHVVLNDTRGCAFFSFISDKDDAFVLVGGL